MNRTIVVALLLVGMGIGAGIVGPTAKNLLTDAHAATGMLVNFSVETHQGVVALKTLIGYTSLRVKVNRIEPNAAGTSFKAFLSLSSWDTYSSSTQREKETMPRGLHHASSAKGETDPCI